MEKLLEQYSISTIIIIIIALAASVKAFVTFFDWGYQRLDAYFKKQRVNDTQETEIQNLTKAIEEQKKDNAETRKSIQDLMTVANNSYVTQKETDQSIKDSIKEIQNELSKITQKQDKMDERINLLTDSDREDIKAFITREHHYFCYTMKWIDNYSLECCEKRFQYYQKEHGNSFVEHLMDELRALPKIPPDAANIVRTP